MYIYPASQQNGAARAPRRAAAAAGPGQRASRASRHTILVYKYIKNNNK